jgi:hypothetical protein
MTDVFDEMAGEEMPGGYGRYKSGRENRSTPMGSSGSWSNIPGTMILKERVATEVAPQSWQAGPRRLALSIRKCQERSPEILIWRPC